MLQNAIMYSLDTRIYQNVVEASYYDSFLLCKLSSFIANQSAAILTVLDIYCRYVSSFKLLGIFFKNTGFTKSFVAVFRVNNFSLSIQALLLFKLTVVRGGRCVFTLEQLCPALGPWQSWDVGKFQIRWRRAVLMCGLAVGPGSHIGSASTWICFLVTGGAATGEVRDVSVQPPVWTGHRGAGLMQLHWPPQHSGVMDQKIPGLVERDVFPLLSPTKGENMELISARMKQFNAQIPLLSLCAMHLTNQSS